MGVIPMIPLSLKRVCPQTWKVIILLQVRTQISHIEGGGNAILFGKPCRHWDISSPRLQKAHPT